MLRNKYLLQIPILFYRITENRALIGDVMKKFLIHHTHDHDLETSSVMFFTLLPHHRLISIVMHKMHSMLGCC